MCSTSPNSKDVWNLRLMWLLKTPFHWNRLDLQDPSHQDSRPTRPSHTQQDYSILQDTLEWSLRRRSHVGTWRLPAIQLSRISSNEVTTQPPLIFLASITISGQDFLLRGEGCNTMCYGSPNPSLITIFSGLGMHDATGLIHSESSQRHFWFNLNLNHRIWTNRFLVWTSTSYPWVGSESKCSQQPLFQVSSKFKVSRRNYIKFSQILT
jgi:hypothetical protein